MIYLVTADCNLTGIPKSGMPPFIGAKQPLIGITTFGKTDANFKAGQIPFPVIAHVARLNRKGIFPRNQPIPPIAHKISGVTKDSVGAVLGSCVVDLFDTATDVLKATTVSAADGSYSVPASPSKGQYAIAYKAGSPDVAGTTVNTLVGS
jgi:hypothetical protein